MGTKGIVTPADWERRIARNTPFAKRLLHWRKKAGLKQAALARAAGVSKSTVCKWEHALATPRDPQRVADALGIALRIFWADIDDAL